MTYCNFGGKYINIFQNKRILYKLFKIFVI